MLAFWTKPPGTTIGLPWQISEAEAHTNIYGLCSLTYVCVINAAREIRRMISRLGGGGGRNSPRIPNASTLECDLQATVHTLLNCVMDIRWAPHRSAQDSKHLVLFAACTSQDCEICALMAPLNIPCYTSKAEAQRVWKKRDSECILETCACEGNKRPWRTSKRITNKK